MKLTAEDYQRHYRELSDDEFLAIDRDDLVEVARRCYDAEMAHRQLAPPPDAVDKEPDSAAPPTPTADPHEELARVAVLSQLNTAIYAQKMLQEADIPADLTNAADLPGNLARGRFEISVPTSCAESAGHLLAGILAGENQDLVRHWIDQEWTPEDLELTDFSVTIDDLFGEFDKVAVRMTIHGTDPHTGKEVALAALAIARVAEGKIAKSWVKFDR
jgi:hypothetical protein